MTQPNSDHDEFHRLHLQSSPWKAEWTFPDGVTYLNHGSFGPAPQSVQQERHKWTDRLEQQPMQFFLREAEQRLDDACTQLGRFVGVPGKDLIFVDNATFGMNVVAASIGLRPGDEVLLTDHEYGAVVRLWRRRCQEAGAKVITAELPLPMHSRQDIVDAVVSRVTPNTRLIVVSHVTSPTAVILPVADICREARSRGIAVCIDGPHALGMLPLSLRDIGCDFYTASCHKWLCAPFGSGFLYVSPPWQGRVRPAVVSWGRSLSGGQPSWKDDFRWIGTRDPAAFLAVPKAIEFLNNIGPSLFRKRGYELATEARRRVEDMTGLTAFVPESPDWLGTMAAVSLPELNVPTPPPWLCDPLQRALWDRFQIEAPVAHWKDWRLLRVSCHLYNDRDDLDRLMEALNEVLPQFSRCEIDSPQNPS